MTQPNQRQFTRSPLESTVDVVDIESGIGFRADAVDICDRGLSFHAPMEPALGADMQVTLTEAGPVDFKVLRIKPTGKGFSVAGVLGRP
jgi:hypothetical protein